MKKYLFLAIALIILFNSGSYASENKGIIKGKVEIKGKHIENAQIILINENMETFITSTNKEGYYQYTNLPYGKYLLTMQYEGKFYLDYINKK